MVPGGEGGAPGGTVVEGGVGVLPGEVGGGLVVPGVRGGVVGGETDGGNPSAASQALFVTQDPPRPGQFAAQSRAPLRGSSSVEPKP